MPCSMTDAPTTTGHGGQIMTINRLYVCSLLYYVWAGSLDPHSHCSRQRLENNPIRYNSAEVLKGAGIDIGDQLQHTRCYFLKTIYPQCGHFTTIPVSKAVPDTLSMSQALSKARLRKRPRSFWRSSGTATPAATATQAEYPQSANDDTPGLNEKLTSGECVDTSFWRDS